MLRQSLRKYVLGTLIFLIYRAFYATWRIKEVLPAEMQDRFLTQQPLILAHWHGDELALMHLIAKYKLVTITSTSKDGELIDWAIRLIGGTTTRGSSTRGGIQALKGLLRYMQQGRSTSFAVDGPKGPIYEVKPGVIEVSRLTKAPIFVSGVYCPSAWKFKKSWNQTYLPKPFSKIYIYWAGPYGPFLNKEDPKDKNVLLSLADALHKARADCFKKFA